jgi:hypothetical protein
VIPHSSCCVSRRTILVDVPSFRLDAMDLNSLKPNPSRSTFLSRVYTTPQPSSNPRAYLSTSRHRANTPSFFGKNIPHSTGRNSESHLAKAVLQRGDSSAPLYPSDAEDGSIYAGHKNHRYFAHSNEDTLGQHPYDNLSGTSHVLDAHRIEPQSHKSRAGMPDGSLFKSRILIFCVKVPRRCTNNTFHRMNYLEIENKIREEVSFD